MYINNENMYFLVMQDLLYTRFYNYSRRIYKKLAYYANKMYNYAIR